MFINKEIRFVVKYVSLIVEDLISNFKKYHLPPLTVLSLSKALYILRKYPKETIRGSIEISSSYYSKNVISYSNLSLNNNYIELKTGGYKSNPVGGDSYTSFLYQSSTDDPITLEDLDTWKQNFYSHFVNTKKGIEIKDYAELIERDSE